MPAGGGCRRRDIRCRVEEAPVARGGLHEKGEGEVAGPPEGGMAPMTEGRRSGFPWRGPRGPRRAARRARDERRVHLPVAVELDDDVRAELERPRETGLHCAAPTPRFSRCVTRTRRGSADRGQTTAPTAVRRGVVDDDHVPDDRGDSGDDVGDGPGGAEGGDDDRDRHGGTPRALPPMRRCSRGRCSPASDAKRIPPRLPVSRSWKARGAGTARRKNVVLEYKNCRNRVHPGARTRPDTADGFVRNSLSSKCGARSLLNSARQCELASRATTIPEGTLPARGTSSRSTARGISWHFAGFA